VVDDGPAPGKAAVRSATVDGPWADSSDRDEDDEASGGLRGARSELRAKLRSQRRLRVISLVSLSILVLGLLPLFFGVRAASRDPVFSSLDALDVPGWAAEQIDDKSSGSRWCFLNCRFRERTAQSERPFEETNNAYTAALTGAGWQPWQVGQCPEQPISDGKYTCWRRDEFTLDLWVRLPECAVDAVAAQDPATLPSTGPDGVVSTEKPADCVGSTVSIKVQNAITDQRGKPQPAPDPGLIGETPDPVLSTDPLLDPTPSPS
jgi:integrin beta 3